MIHANNMEEQDLSISSRVVDIDSRDFASIERAVLELATNSDESYYRLEQRGIVTSSKIYLSIIRKLSGSVLTCIDEAEGMDYRSLLKIAEFGGAFGDLATKGAGGRSFFGRGLKQSIYGLGKGTVETIKDGKYSIVEFFKKKGIPKIRHQGDVPANSGHYSAVGIPEGSSGTKVNITVEKEIKIPLLSTMNTQISNHFAMRDIVNRRQIYLKQVRENGTILDSFGPLRYLEPEHDVLVGPDKIIEIEWQGKKYEALLTLKRSKVIDLNHVGEERTGGLLIKADIAILACTLFMFDRQLGTERLFGELRCDALHRLLKNGEPVINTSRTGLNMTSKFVQQLAIEVEKSIEAVVLKERENREKIDSARTSEATRRKVQDLLKNFNNIANEELKINDGSETYEGGQVKPNKTESMTMRFSTPIYIRKVNKQFRVTLLVDTEGIPPGTTIILDANCPDSIKVLSQDLSFIIEGEKKIEEFSISLIGSRVGDQGEIIALAEVNDELKEVKCDILIRSEGEEKRKKPKILEPQPPKGSNVLFKEWAFGSLYNEIERTNYEEDSGKIIINTDAPTVKMYFDKNGNFIDDKSGLVLLAELLMDCVTEQLAQKYLSKTAINEFDSEAVKAQKQDFIRKYGVIFHKALLAV